MTRISDKTIVNRQFNNNHSLRADFVPSEIDATIRDKSYDVILEKAILCPCKDKETPAHLSTCQNCGGTGWIFVNPTKTRMIISGIAADGKLKEAALREWGMVDSGVVKVTAINDDRFSYMDRITITDALADHNQILTPNLTDDENSLFAFTKYDIVNIENVAFFNGVSNKLTRLVEPDDYTFENNIITFRIGYNDISKFTVSIRYSHRPMFHIIDIMREYMTSTKGQYGQGQTKMFLPVHAVAKRAHLIADIENYDGDRLIDNSWLPDTCQTDSLTKFQRQLKYATAQEIYNNLTPTQITQLDTLIHS